MCISVMMQSSNQRCNALQSMLGVFLHSCNTPEVVRECLAHMGISISVSAINSAVANLSKQSEVKMRHIGKSLLTSYAYDNLDIDLKHSVPSVEKPQDTLIHLTSGMMLPLNHGVTLEDLDCCEELWKKSANNPSARRRGLLSIKVEDLLLVHLEDDHPSGLLRRERFNAWKFLHDLINFGPKYFRKYRRELGDPEVIEQIPLVKTFQVPNKALDISPNAPAQNAEALEAFFRQAGIGDSTENTKAHDINNHVTLVFGDLLTGERIRSLQESRSEEVTAWRRLQSVVFVMGLFHLKMACADAIWRIFIHPTAAKDDVNSLIEHIGQIRPKETGKIGSGPGFQWMHEVIQHVGIVSRLDCWRLEAGKDSVFRSLEEFAKSLPDFAKLHRMANMLCREQIAQPDHVFNSNPANDEQHRNALLRQQYFLLYEEISHMLNYGDIGRVEACFMPWAFIFQGCGKHKYAAEMQGYLRNVHFIYPEGLKCVAL
jgi:hypothetical protein